MKVTLAYEHDGHKPDSTIEVDDITGRTLLREGNARPADASSRKAAAAVIGDNTDSAQPTSRPTRQTTEKKG